MIDFFILSLVILSLACFFRLIKGPTVADRIIAGDTIGVLLSMVILLLAIKLGINIFLDILMVYAILLFADVLILAKLFEKRELYK